MFISLANSESGDECNEASEEMEGVMLSSIPLNRWIEPSFPSRYSRSYPTAIAIRLSHGTSVTEWNDVNG